MLSLFLLLFFFQLPKFVKFNSAHAEGGLEEEGVSGCKDGNSASTKTASAELLRACKINISEGNETVVGDSDGRYF